MANKLVLVKKRKKCLECLNLYSMLVILVIESAPSYAVKGRSLFLFSRGQGRQDGVPQDGPTRGHQEARPASNLQRVRDV